MAVGMTEMEVASTLLTLEATGMDRFGAIAMIAPYAKEVVPKLWVDALRLVTVPKGTFTMGAPKREKNRYGFEGEGPIHEVTITRDFQMAAMPTTQGAWMALIGSNPSHFQGVPPNGGMTWGLPVEQVSWNDICGKDGFLERLNAATEGARPTGMVFRLPTEAEWEYACRSGTCTVCSFGDDPKGLGEHGWFAGNAESRTHPVGQKAPNAWGLFDLHGNVWEWSLDWFGDYPKQAQTDPEGPFNGDIRVLRGGSWLDSHEGCRSACRRRRDPCYLDFSIGFRVVLALPTQTKSL